MTVWWSEDIPQKYILLLCFHFCVSFLKRFLPSCKAILTVTDLNFTDFWLEYLNMNNLFKLDLMGQIDFNRFEDCINLSASCYLLFRIKLIPIQAWFCCFFKISFETQNLLNIEEIIAEWIFFLQGNATLHLYPHFEPLRQIEGKAYSTVHFLFF